MTKSATEIMREILFSSVVDAVMALKDGARGVPNALLREISAIHPNITFADLTPDLQKAIDDSVRGAFTRLMKEGYAVTPAGPPPRGPTPPRPENDRPQNLNIRRGPPGARAKRPPLKRG